jgi:hypothetical protein
MVAEGLVPPGKCGDIVLFKTVHRLLPPPNAVPDASTAIAMARSTLIPLYCPQGIDRDTAFAADETQERWIVRGRLRCSGQESGTGEAEVQIAKNDGRVLSSVYEQ